LNFCTKYFLFHVKKSSNLKMDLVNRESLEAFDSLNDIDLDRHLRPTLNLQA